MVIYYNGFCSIVYFCIVTVAFFIERVFLLKKSKFLAILLAVIITLSSFSCLSVVSFAAVDGGVRDEDGNVVEKEWLYDEMTNVFTVYADITDNTWLVYKDDIVEVIFTENVKNIESFMFSDSTNLGKVVFDANLDAIGKGAFQNCDKINFSYLSLPVCDTWFW